MATTYDSDTKRNSIYGDTSSILYNYAIARTLFDSVKNKFILYLYKINHLLFSIN